MSAWAFEHLNELNSSLLEPTYFDSPTNWDSSPPSGLTDPLASSLEAWTSAAFNFDHADFGGPTGYDGLFPEKEECADAGEEERGRYKLAGVKRREDSPPTLQDLLNSDSSFELGGDGATFSISPAEFPSYVDQVLQFDGGIVPSLSVASTQSLSPEASSQKDANRPSTRATKKRKLSAEEYSTSFCASTSPSPAVSAEPLDKRQRNTAASARFRTKKKEREAALETTVKQLSEKASQLEDEVDMLATENTWLRSLITGKFGKVPEPLA